MLKTTYECFASMLIFVVALAPSDPAVAEPPTCKVSCEDKGDQQDGDDDRPYSNDPIKGQLQFELHHEASQCPTLLILRGARQDEFLQLLAREQRCGHV